MTNCIICNSKNYVNEDDLCHICVQEIHAVYVPQLEVEQSVIPKTPSGVGRVKKLQGQP